METDGRLAQQGISDERRDGGGEGSRMRVVPRRAVVGTVDPEEGVGEPEGEAWQVRQKVRIGQGAKQVRAADSDEAAADQFDVDPAVDDGDNFGSPDRVEARVGSFDGVWRRCARTGDLDKTFLDQTEAILQLFDPRFEINHRFNHENPPKERVENVSSNCEVLSCANGGVSV